MVYLTKDEALKLIDMFMSEYDYDEYSDSWKQIIDKLLKSCNLKAWKPINGIVMCEEIKEE